MHVEGDRTNPESKLCAVTPFCDCVTHRTLPMMVTCSVVVTAALLPLSRAAVVLLPS